MPTRLRAKNIAEAGKSLKVIPGIERQSKVSQPSSVATPDIPVAWHEIVRERCGVNEGSRRSHSLLLSQILAKADSEADVAAV